MKGFLAHMDFKQDLFKELNSSDQDLWLGPLCLSSSHKGPSIWAQQEWLNPEVIEIRSIRHAADELRARGRNWSPVAHKFHRRSQLIVDLLPKLSSKKLKFLSDLPTLPMGAFALESESRLWLSRETNHPLPLGKVEFNENKSDPPSRAYLKLWELFTLHFNPPEKGEFCLDLGASPGGWTWVLSQLGAKVLAVDRTLLAPSLMKKVTFERASAFSLKPENFDSVDWLFSDVICYPGKLLEFVHRWVESGRVAKIVCTIKFQGETDFDILREFGKIPGAWIRHLYHNKHEVTFVWRATPRLGPPSP